MKSKILLALCAVVSMSAHGVPRSEKEALQEAVSFFRSNPSVRRAAGTSTALKYAYSAVQANGEAAFYVFNRGENEGFVMVSAESNTPTIIGYSETGRFDPEDLPAGLQAWMEEYKEEIARAGESAHAYAPQAGGYTPVAPLCTTQWGQGTPYNNLCPYYTDKRAVTGCVATAAAQIMKYHSYPEQGIGSHSYKWANANGDSVQLSADFGSTTYDWTHMIDSYDESATETQTNAVATLMSHCGIAVEMDYRSSNSSADSRDMNQALIERFGYDKGIRHLLKDYMGTDMLMSAISYDLQHGRPVYISAKTIDNGGHAFICDGIDSDGLLHINWGWKGKSDGYYLLSLFNPKDQGTGGSASKKAYTEKIGIYMNIRPDEGGNYVHSLVCDNIRPGQEAYHRDSSIVIYIDTLRNEGFMPWEGNLSMGVLKDGQSYKSRRISSTANPLKEGMFRKRLNYRASFANRETYPEGEYAIVLGVWDVKDENTFVTIYRKWVGQWRCNLTITSDSIYLTPPVIVVPGAEQGIEAPVVKPERPAAQKYIRDGQLFILKGKDIYDFKGQRL